MAGQVGNGWLRLRRPRLAALIAGGLVPFAGLAQTEPLGATFQVNALTTDRQRGPEVHGTPDGGFLVIWHSRTSAGTDDSGLSVQARRFDQDGSPVGVEFQVNTQTTQSQSDARVAVRGDGSYVVTWRGVFDGNKGLLGSIQAQVFAPSDVGVAPEFVVAVPSNIYEFFQDHDLESVDGGEFVVVTSPYYTNYSDPPISTVDFRVVSDAGALLHGTGLDFSQYPTRVRVDGSSGDGARGAAEFVVAWQSGSEAYVDSTTEARRVSNSGVADPTVEVVDPFGYVGGTTVDVALGDSGDFVVALNGYDSYGGSPTELLLRRFDHVDTPDTAAPIALGGGPSPGDVQLARGGDGSFLMVWTAHDTPGDEGAGVRARRLDRAGRPVASEFQVNTLTAYDQTEPAVAAVRGGREFVVVWASQSAGGVEDWEIRGRRFVNHGLFHDDFETSDVLRWASSSP